MAENAQTDVKKLSFERAIEELETIVKRLEEGKVPLEESVTIYERGEALKRRCEELLRQAEARVEKITTDASGQASGVEPLDVQERSAHRPTCRRRSAPHRERLSRTGGLTFSCGGAGGLACRPCGLALCAALV